MRLALFQPDIPQNAGAMLRLAACLNVPVDIIEPCGFVLGERRFRRAGLDYLDRAAMVRHASWQAYCSWRGSRADSGRLLLITTKGDMPYTGFMFRADDTLMMGRESLGVPDAVAEVADARLRIPMAAGLRSINVAQAAAMVLGEALRQTGMFPAAI
ncbi:MAG TPA: tRNA (cytidine(34)-2'-O)-methyltransferase [Alphaproteobacteria bacterium]|nr:tRNA (cytidine(34)-2'-O)-methyltransferase [Alphaproteobacteria bacterium]